MSQGNGTIEARSVFENQIAAAIFALSLIFCGLALAKLVDDNIRQAQETEERRELSEEAFEIAADIERRFAFYDFIAGALSTAVAIDPALDQDTFSDLVSPFFVTDPGILNVALERDWQVTHVHPVEANRSVIGLNYRDHPVFRSDIQQIRDTGASTLTGPNALLQGVEGLIFRIPLSVNGSVPRDLGFEGSVAIVSTVESVLNLASENQQDRLVNLIFDGEEEGDPSITYGTIPDSMGEPVSKTVNIAGREITVQIIPETGWGSTYAPSFVIYGVALGIVVVILALLFWARALIAVRRKGWETLSEAIEAIDDGFALYDRNDCLVLCNSRYKSFYNKSAHLMVPGAKFSDIVWGGVVAGQYKDAIGREEEWFAERMEAHRNPKGSTEQKLDDRWLKISEARLDDGSRVGFRVDISSLKKAQHNAEAANRAKTDFLNVMSHEIRTPLSAILGFSNVLSNVDSLPAVMSLRKTLEEQDLDAKAKADTVVTLFKEYAGRIDANGQHLLSLVNDILYWNDIDTTDRPLGRDPIDVSTLVSTTREQLSGMAEKKGLTFETHGAHACVRGDQVRLQQVVVNLVGNAIKFTSHGSISLSVTEMNGEVEIAVQDTGCGIPEEHLDDIFASFFQVQSGLDRAFGGSGLGLAISRDIVEKHGGSITVESTVGEGSTFRVRLPKYEVASAAA